MPIEVSVRELSVSYGRVDALRSVSVTAPAGSILGVLGPSGSGKTTLIKGIAGLIHLKSGSILFDGRDVVSVEAPRRRVGMVFQSLALFPNLTVSENVGYPLEARGFGKQAVEGRVAEVLKLVRLEGLAERYPRELSGGQQQRVAIARALAPEDIQVLLMDEPLSNLDEQLAAELIPDIRRIQREAGITTIYVTHDQGEAFSVADYVAIMFDGRIEAFGRAEDVYSRPATVRAAHFLGARNSVDAKLLFERGEAWAQIGPLKVRAEASQEFGDGEDVIAVFRPSDVEITKGGMEGRVLGARFANGSYITVISTPIGEIVSHSERPHAQGERVGIGITRVMAYKASGWGTK